MLNMNELPPGEKMAMNIITLNTAVNDLQEGYAKHHKVLIEGNGELPIVERVRNLEAYTNGIRFWMRTIAVAIVMQTITFGGVSVALFIKAMPLLAKIANGEIR